MDELNKILAEVLVVVKDGAAWSAAMAKQEIPLVVEEYLRWAIVQGVAAVVVWLMVVVPSVVLLKRGVRGLHENDADSGAFAQAMIGGAVLFVSAFALVIEVLPRAGSALQAYVAPRVYLLEQLSALVK